MEKRVHKRFAAFLASLALLVVGFLLGPVEAFAAFAGALTLLYGSYLGGQSLTDHTKIKNGG